MKESDLYPPLKAYLEGQGYDVKGEVNHCDVVGVRQSEVIIVELKKSLNLGALLQVVERLSTTDAVYIGVPTSCTVLKSKRKQVTKLVKMLGLGLISIDPNNKRLPVAVHVDPAKFQPRIDKNKRARLLSEFERRVGDPNQGGTAMKNGVITAYRQEALKIADHLSQYGPTKASIVAQAVDNPKTRDVLYRDVYGWFERRGQGIYELSPRGRRELTSWSKRTGY